VCRHVDIGDLLILELIECKVLVLPTQMPSAGPDAESFKLGPHPRNLFS
jgi:hypothetical protein